MVQLFDDQKLDYQLVARGDHRLLSAERAIQTFVRTGIDSSFLKQSWNHALYRLVIILNMLRLSRLNPKISAYIQVNSNHNFNKNPLTSVGC